MQPTRDVTPRLATAGQHCQRSPPQQCQHQGRCQLDFAAGAHRPRHDQGEAFSQSPGRMMRLPTNHEASWCTLLWRPRDLPLFVIDVVYCCRCFSARFAAVGNPMFLNVRTGKTCCNVSPTLLNMLTTCYSGNLLTAMNAEMLLFFCLYCGRT